MNVTFGAFWLLFVVFDCIAPVVSPRTGSGAVESACDTMVDGAANQTRQVSSPPVVHDTQILSD